MRNIGKVVGFVITLVFLTVIFIPGLGDVAGRYINPVAEHRNLRPENDFSLLLVTIVSIAIIVVFIYIVMFYEGVRM